MTVSLIGARQRKVKHHFNFYRLVIGHFNVHRHVINSDEAHRSSILRPVLWRRHPWLK